MTKTGTIWTGVSTAIVGFATMLGAQTTSAPQSTTPNTEAQITVTGCLKQGVMTVAPTGTAGGAGTVRTGRRVEHAGRGEYGRDRGSDRDRGYDRRREYDGRPNRAERIFRSIWSILSPDRESHRVEPTGREEAGPDRRPRSARQCGASQRRVRWTRRQGTCPPSEVGQNRGGVLSVTIGFPSPDALT